MAKKQLFPVFDLPQEETQAEQKAERYKPSAYFDFARGDFRRDGANRIAPADGKNAFIQWCLKAISTERMTRTGYHSDYGVELEKLPSDRAEAESIIEREVREALMVNPATEDVYGFDYTWEGDECLVTFTVKGYQWVEESVLSVRV